MASKLHVLSMFSTLIIAASSQSYPFYRRQCEDIFQPQNSKLEMRSFYYIVHCDSGYTISGNSVVYCRDGQWENPPPKCVKNTITVCPEALSPENGEKKCDKGPLYPGRVCRFRCSDGFTLYGLNMRRCMWNLQWSGKQPKCISETGISCPVPPPLKNGTVIGCSSTVGPTVGKTCNFRCNPGYVLQGSHAVVCTRSGKLKDMNGQESMPKCEAVTPSYCERYNPCQNGGFCIGSGEESFSCRCPARFTGKKCEVLTNPCQSSPCKNGGICRTPTVGTYVCQCVPQFSGTHCEKKECPPNFCQNGGTCVHNSIGFHCSCPRGIAGAYCQERLRTDPQEATTIGNVDKIEEPTSHNQGSHHTSENPAHSSSVERRGYNASIRTCSRDNGGCEQTCDERYGRILCGCWKEYILESNGRSCRRVESGEYNACSRDIGGCEHICDSTYRRIRCKCRQGYTLARDQRSCHDIDECAYEVRNRCQYKCHNFDGGYNCSCPNGYHKVNEYRCEGCKKNTYWVRESSECERCPDNSHTRVEGKTSIGDCLCLEGYSGNPGENIPCEDVDECAIQNFGCSHKCINTPGSAFCSCPLGYTLDVDEKTCIDIDECSIKNGGCEGTCINNEGSFRCFCLEGYTTSNKDHFSCDDIDECLEDNAGCEQKCNNYPGGYYCSCEKGFRLDSGLENCTDIRCPAFTIPHYSRPKCKLNKNLPNLESYPVGTVCNFKCSKGFKSVSSSNSIICLNNGTWEGTTPQCKSEQCPALLVPENGQVHPPSCSREGTSVKHICTFTCNSGYRLVGKSVFTCKNNLSWTVEDIPVCRPIGIQPVIKCPEDISVDLLPGKDSHNITVPSPISNVEDLKIQPNWVSTDVPVKFLYGTTNIIFTASDTNYKRRAQCTMSVNILDKELPVFDFCPKSFEADGAGADGITVTWEDPVVSDNVAVVSLQSNMEPNSTLMPGTYSVIYIAKDDAGNLASCEFDINVTRIPCSDLDNPVNGKANCMHWMFGKMCKPLCDAGYTRHPNNAILHTCGDSGNWKPSESISDCLKYIPAVSSTCPDQYELINLKETGEEICVECPKTTVWSASTKKCEAITY